MSDRGGPITPENGIAPDWRDRRIAELEGQLREAQATIAALRAQIVQLQQRIAELERAGNCAVGDLSSTSDLGNGFPGQGAASRGRGNTVVGRGASG